MFSISNLQRAQQANLRHIASLRPGGSLEAAVKSGTLAAQRYAVSVSHVQTGSMRAAERVDVVGARGVVYIDPVAVNPRSGARVSAYAHIEHARGGEHAFFARTVNEAGRSIADGMVTVYKRGLR